MSPQEVDREILDIIPEPFGELPGNRRRRFGARLRLVPTLLLGGAAVVAAVAGWYIFTASSELSPSPHSELPLICADSRPIKARPEEPGGLIVPNQDKLVYENLGRGDHEPKVERLLPPPEQPKPPPVTAALPPSEPNPGAVSPEIIVPDVAPSLRAPSPAKPEAPRPSVETLPPAAAETAKATTPRGDFMLQLAAMGTLDAAEKAWVRLRKDNPDLLGNLSSDILKVDLGARGTFYRLRAGAMDELAARALCAQLAKRNTGCMVVRK